MRWPPSGSGVVHVYFRSQPRRRLWGSGPCQFGNRKRPFGGSLSSARRSSSWPLVTIVSITRSRSALVDQLVTRISTMPADPEPTLLMFTAKALSRSGKVSVDDDACVAASATTATSFSITIRSVPPAPLFSYADPACLNEFRMCIVECVKHLQSACMRAPLVVMLVAASVLAVPAVGRAQNEQIDLFDLWNRLRHKPPPASDPEQPQRTIAIAPVLGSNPTAGVTLGAAGQVTFVRGDPSTTRLSSGIGSLSYSTKNQLLIFIRFSVFSRDNVWFVEGDNRFQLAGQDIYGLGTNTPESAAITTDYDFVRVHETLYRKVADRVYVGGGFLVDSHTDVSPADDDHGAWSQSPYVEYSSKRGLPLDSQQSAGLSVNFLVDKRDGEIDPRRGWLASTSYRASWRGLLGSDSNWNDWHTELRTFTPIRRTSRLALWLTGDVSSGDAPYFDLPATVMDMYGRSSRGYREGRYRGERQVYGEAEYRATLTRNG